MACYIVTFEVGTSTAAEAIRQHLKGLGGYCPINSTSWAITTGKTAVEIRNSLSQISPDARIFVVRSGTEAAWRHSYGEKNDEWLKNYL